MTILYSPVRGMVENRGGRHLTHIKLLKRQWFFHVSVHKSLHWKHTSSGGAACSICDTDWSYSVRQFGSQNAHIGIASQNGGIGTRALCRGSFHAKQWVKWSVYDPRPSKLIVLITLTHLFYIISTRFDCCVFVCHPQNTNVRFFLYVCVPSVRSFVCLSVSH